MLIGKLNQTATYWSPGVSDGFGGYEPGTRTELDVRWQDKQQLVRDREGDEIVSEAVIYSTEDLDTEGDIAKGTHANSEPIAGSYEIRAKESMVTIGGTILGYKYWV